MTEKTASDAPVWYSAEEASAWANGHNSAIEECAKVCEARIRGTDGLPGGNEYGHKAPYNAEDLACAAAIRKMLD